MRRTSTTWHSPHDSRNNWPPLVGLYTLQQWVDSIQLSARIVVQSETSPELNISMGICLI